MDQQRPVSSFPPSRDINQATQPRRNNNLSFSIGRDHTSVPRNLSRSRSPVGGQLSQDNRRATQDNLIRHIEAISSHTAFNDLFLSMNGHWQVESLEALSRKVGQLLTEAGPFDPSLVQNKLDQKRFKQKQQALCVYVINACKLLNPNDKVKVLSALLPVLESDLLPPQRRAGVVMYLLEAWPSHLLDSDTIQQLLAILKRTPPKYTPSGVGGPRRDPYKPFKMLLKTCSASAFSDAKAMRAFLEFVATIPAGNYQGFSPSSNKKPPNTGDQYWAFEALVEACRKNGGFHSSTTRSLLINFIDQTEMIKDGDRNTVFDRRKLSRSDNWWYGNTWKQIFNEYKPFDKHQAFRIFEENFMEEFADIFMQLCPETALSDSHTRKLLTNFINEMPSDRRSWFFEAFVATSWPKDASATLANPETVRSLLTLIDETIPTVDQSWVVWVLRKACPSERARCDFNDMIMQWFTNKIAVSQDPPADKNKALIDFMDFMDLI